MINNDALKDSYGDFSEARGTSILSRYRPIPSSSDYASGYIRRTFLKKINENVIIEINPSDAYSINSALYKAVDLRWKITGPKNNISRNGIFDKAGVADQNKFEIERVKNEQGVDLSVTLGNLLEYWRGS